MNTTALQALHEDRQVLNARAATISRDRWCDHRSLMTTWDETPQARGMLPELRARIRRQGIEIIETPPPAGVTAVAATDARSVILVDPAVNADQKVHALLHETGHIVLRHSDVLISQWDGEVQAEGACYLALRRLGYDCLDYAAHYLAAWSDFGPGLTEENWREAERGAALILAFLDLA